MTYVPVLASEVVYLVLDVVVQYALQCLADIGKDGLDGCVHALACGNALVIQRGGLGSKQLVYAVLCSTHIHAKNDVFYHSSLAK